VRVSATALLSLRVANRQERRGRMLSREGLALVVNLAENLEATFCPTDLDVIYEEGFCCNEDQELDIIMQLSASTATGRCAEMQQEVRK